MTKEEAQAYYAGKKFFIKRPDGTVDGPREDIYLAVPTAEYKFIQITDGTPRQAFKEHEILVVQE